MWLPATLGGARPPSCVAVDADQLESPVEDRAALRGMRVDRVDHEERAESRDEQAGRSGEDPQNSCAGAVERCEKRRREDLLQEVELLEKDTLGQSVTGGQRLPRDQEYTDQHEHTAESDAEEHEEQDREEQPVGLMETDEYDGDTRRAREDAAREAEGDELAEARGLLGGVVSMSMPVAIHGHRRGHNFRN